MKILALGLLLLPTQDLADNPEFPRWAAFKPGAWASHRMTTESPQGKKEGEALVRLAEKKTDRVVIRQKISLDVTDPLTISETSREIPARIEREASLELSCKKTSEAPEEIDAAGRKFRCSRLDLVDPGGSRLLLWVCPEVPGGVVRMERKATAAEPVSYVMVLTAWKADDALPAPPAAQPPPEVPLHLVAHAPFGKGAAWKTGTAPREQVVVNGTAGAEFQSVSWPPLFSPDGTRVAYFGRKGNDVVLVVDQTTVDTFRWIRPGGPMAKFSADGRRLAWTREQPDQKVAVSVDGKAGRPFDEIREFFLTREGLPAYLARDLNASKSFTVVGEEAKEVPAGQTAYVGPGGRFALVAGLPGGKKQLTFESHKSEAYAILQGPLWSPDGSRILYVGFPTSSECFVVVDGKKSEAYRNVSLEQVRFSADGKRHAYVAFPPKGTGIVLVIDGKKVDTQGYVRDIVFSADGRRVGYVQMGKSMTAVIDGKKGPEFPGVNSIMFSPDGRHVAYVARREPGPPPESGPCYFAILDGKAGEVLEEIQNIEFDPSGKLLWITGVLKGRPVQRSMKSE